MKKIFLNAIFAVLPLTIMAQLPYDTELTKDLFNDPTIVIAKEGTIEWSSIKLGSLDFSGMYMGETVVFGDDKTHSVQIALPSIGLPNQLTFSYAALTANGGTWTVSESSNHSTWTVVRSGTIDKGVTKTDESAILKSSTRYLKFEYVGKAHMLYNAVRVTEKKELSVSIDEYQFPTAKVDAQSATKTVKINWTNVVGTITSTNPAFTLSRSTFGEKNAENQTTELVISYSHDTYGTQEGLIVFEAEGLKDTVKVSGTTERYPQTLTWNQNLNTLKTTDKVMLQAFTSLSQPVSYLISDSNLAEVDEENFLVIKCAGTVDITAYHPGDRKYEPTNQITKTVTFVKVDPMVSVSASAITYGQSLRDVELVENLGEVSGTLEFRNINVDTILNAGTYNLKVAFVPEDSCIYNEVVRQVQVVVNKATQTITWIQGVTSLYVGDTITLTAYASSHLPLTYAFTSCNVYIDGDKLVGLEAGDVLVIAFQAGNDNYYPSAVAMQPFEVKETPTPTSVSERMAEPSEDEVMSNGQKYYHNGHLYIYYRGRLYNAEGLRLK